MEGNRKKERGGERKGKEKGARRCTHQSIHPLQHHHPPPSKHCLPLSILPLGNVGHGQESQASHHNSGASKRSDTEEHEHFTQMEMKHEHEKQL